VRRPYAGEGIPTQSNSQTIVSRDVRAEGGHLVEVVGLLAASPEFPDQVSVSSDGEFIGDVGLFGRLTPAQRQGGQVGDRVADKVAERPPSWMLWIVREKRPKQSANKVAAWFREKGERTEAVADPRRIETALDGLLDRARIERFIVSSLSVAPAAVAVAQGSGQVGQRRRCRPNPRRPGRWTLSVVEVEGPEWRRRRVGRKWRLEGSRPWWRLGEWVRRRLRGARHLGDVGQALAAGAIELGAGSRVQARQVRQR
jgi:hypothetical protein